MPKNLTHGDIAAELENAAAALSVATERFQSLQEQLLRTKARGTRDVAPQARAAIGAATGKLATPPAPPALPLTQRIEGVLRHRIASVQEIAAELGSPVVRVVAIVRSLGRRVYNVGTEDRPRWTLVVGDETTNEDLAAALERLLRERPFYRDELREALGARDNRIGGAFNRLQRNRIKIMNIGTNAKARYLIAPSIRPISRSESTVAER